MLNLILELQDKKNKLPFQICLPSPPRVFQLLVESFRIPALNEVPNALNLDPQEYRTFLPLAQQEVLVLFRVLVQELKKFFFVS